MCSVIEQVEFWSLCTFDNLAFASICHEFHLLAQYYLGKAYDEDYYFGYSRWTSFFFQAKGYRWWKKVIINVRLLLLGNALFLSVYWLKSPLLYYPYPLLLVWKQKKEKEKNSSQSENFCRIHFLGLFLIYENFEQILSSSFSFSFFFLLIQRESKNWV